jgi:hypothetical protein
VTPSRRYLPTVTLALRRAQGDRRCTARPLHSGRTQGDRRCTVRPLHSGRTQGDRRCTVRLPTPLCRATVVMSATDSSSQPEAPWLAAGPAPDSPAAAASSGAAAAHRSQPGSLGSGSISGRQSSSHWHHRAAPIKHAAPEATGRGLAVRDYRRGHHDHRHGDRFTVARVISTISSPLRVRLKEPNPGPGCRKAVRVSSGRRRVEGGVESAVRTVPACTLDAIRRSSAYRIPCAAYRTHARRRGCCHRSAEQLRKMQRRNGCEQRSADPHGRGLVWGGAQCLQGTPATVVCPSHIMSCHVYVEISDG